MHELSLCGAIIDTATEHAGGRQVRRINVRIGHLRQVVPETLRFCWSMRIDGTPFEGCELAVTHVPAEVVCRRCGGSTTLEHPVLRCGACDTTEVDLVAGEEFVIESIDLAPDAQDSVHQDSVPTTREDAR